MGAFLDTNSWRRYYAAQPKISEHKTNLIPLCCGGAAEKFHRRAYKGNTWSTETNCSSQMLPRTDLD